jgi:hypothetical protein
MLKNMKYLITRFLLNIKIILYKANSNSSIMMKEHLVMSANKMASRKTL